MRSYTVTKYGPADYECLDHMSKAKVIRLLENLEGNWMPEKPPGYYSGEKLDEMEYNQLEYYKAVDLAVKWLKEGEKERKQKERLKRTASNDDSYTVSGGNFRLLVGDLYELFVAYSSLARHLFEAKTEKDLQRLQKRTAGYERHVKRWLKGWNLSEEGQKLWAYNALEESLRKKILRPVPANLLDGALPQEDITV